MLATVVDTKALWETVVASVVAGVGVTVLFAVAIYGATRATDFARDERSLAAGAAGVLTAVCALAFVAAVVAGIVVMTQK